MRYKLLGKSGLRVSELCLGTMTFGDQWSWGKAEWGSSDTDSREVFETYIEAGGNFFDTANMYTDGTSERILGELVAPQREKAVIASKYCLSTDRKDPNASGSHRKNMVQSVEASLKRLNTDYIDLYWLHAWDYLTPIEEVMRSLDDLVRAGKILYIGISDAPAWVVAQANTLATERGWTPFIATQMEYSLIERSIEPEFLPMMAHLDLALCAWSPLGAGVLTGKYTTVGQAPKGTRLSTSSRINEILSERNIQTAQVTSDIAKELGVSCVQVALAWMRQQGANIFPIVGARVASQLQDSLGYLQLQLEKDHMARLNEVSGSPLGFPHKLLKSDFFRQIVYGDHADNIDHHRPMGVVT